MAPNCRSESENKEEESSHTEQMGKTISVHLPNVLERNRICKKRFQTKGRQSDPDDDEFWPSFKYGKVEN